MNGGLVANVYEQKAHYLHCDSCRTRSRLEGYHTRTQAAREFAVEGWKYDSVLGKVVCSGCVKKSKKH